MTLYIVWNPAKTEGYITNSLEDVREAREGIKGNFHGAVASTVMAAAFYDTYGEDGGIPEAIEITAEAIISIMKDD